MIKGLERPEAGLLDEVLGIRHLVRQAASCAIKVRDVDQNVLLES